MKDPVIPPDAPRDEEPELCGMTKIATLPADHPFTKACAIHDRWHRLKELGKPTPGRRKVDRAFLEAMLRLSKGSFWLKAQAYLYYGLVRLVGKAPWESH